MSWIDEASRVVQAGSQQARILDIGDGYPVVVLHGWGGSIESMAPVADCLRPHLRVIAFDLPGFGGSPVPKGVWGTPDYGTFVRDVLSSIGVTRAHFVGHSYGAKTALYLAATHADLVDKLVLQGSSGLRTPPSASARFKRSVSKGARVVGRFGAPGRAVRKAVYDRIASQDYKDAGEMRPILVKVVNEDMSASCRRIKSPTLLVWGSEDTAAPLAHARRFEELIPDAGLVVFEGAGHFAYLDEPARFCKIVRHFLGVA